MPSITPRETLIESLLKRYSHRGCDKSKELLKARKPEARSQRDFIEYVWTKYSHYFETELKASFYDFYAELLTGFFMAEKQGFQLCNKNGAGGYPNAQSKNHGPDFKVKGEGIWVECIAVEDTATEQRISRTLSYDQNLTEHQRRLGQSKNLMLMNPIRAKAKKYDRYVEDEIVGETDAAIIAVSLHKVDSKISKEQIEQSIKDVFEVFELYQIHGVLCFYGTFGQEKTLFVKNPNNFYKKSLIKPITTPELVEL